VPTVLYLAHGFPPASGSGAVRALAFARYLPMYGWRALVLTPGEPWAANADRRLGAQVPAWLDVRRTASFERVCAPAPATSQAVKVGPEATASDRLGAQLRRHGGHLRRFPDAHLGWLPFAVWAGLRLAPRVDVLFSSSGPFTSHLVGLVLHLLTRRPWVAELRDGWYRWNRSIFPDYPSWRGVLERWLEGQMIRRATRVVCVTERMADAFRCQYPDVPAEHFSVVSNGFDPGAHVAIDAHQDHGRADSFTVVHAGALYYGRSIRPFLHAAARLAEEDAAFASAFRLELVGSLDQTARAEVDRSAVAASVVCHGQIDHPSTLARERAADLLLLVANTTLGAQATVPGKLFEYLASGRPVLAIAPKESATADVLGRTGGGWLADGADPEAVSHQLQAAFRREPVAVDPQQLARFDRRRLAGELARVLEAALLA
jgi:glycosyltransferase involved in cell wall biosynthesis